MTTRMVSARAVTAQRTNASAVNQRMDAPSLPARSLRNGAAAGLRQLEPPFLHRDHQLTKPISQRPGKHVAGGVIVPEVDDLTGRAAFLEIDAIVVAAIAQRERHPATPPPRRIVEIEAYHAVELLFGRGAVGERHEHVIVHERCTDPEILPVPPVIELSELPWQHKAEAPFVRIQRSIIYAWSQYRIVVGPVGRQPSVGASDQVLHDRRSVTSATNTPDWS